MMHTWKKKRFIQCTSHGRLYTNIFPVSDITRLTFWDCLNTPHIMGYNRISVRKTMPGCSNTVIIILIINVKHPFKKKNTI
jgi:hypothetical protein